MNDSAGALQCADMHILMIDRGKLDQACQLTAAAVINQQSHVILDVMTAIIDDRVTCPPMLHPSVGALLQQGLQQHSELITVTACRKCNCESRQIWCCKLFCSAQQSDV